MLPPGPVDDSFMTACQNRGSISVIIPCIKDIEHFRLWRSTPLMLATCGHVSLVVSQKAMVGFHRISLQVDRRDISYIHYIIEGYDVLSTVSTLDRSTGLIQLHYPEACRKDLFDLIHALQEEEVIKEVMWS